MIPFHVDFAPGSPLYEQVVYVATKAIVSGQLRPGDNFPSVRVLSRELKINPNTAHKVVTCLVDAGLLEIRQGSAPVVANRPGPTKAEKANLLQNEFEQLVVEAKRLRIELDDVQDAIARHWARLTSKREDKSDASKGGR
jgi:GntR family transcriptional regulator